MWVIEDPAVIYFGECFAYVFLWSFIVSGLTFRSLIHFVFIFVYGVRKCSSFTLLQEKDTLCFQERVQVRAVEITGGSLGCALTSSFLLRQ